MLRQNVCLSCGDVACSGSYIENTDNSTLNGQFDSKLNSQLDSTLNGQYDSIVSFL